MLFGKSLLLSSNTYSLVLLRWQYFDELLNFYNSVVILSFILRNSYFKVTYCLVIPFFADFHEAIIFAMNFK